MLTTSAALLLGAATSVHCVGMCGPLACSLCTLKGSEEKRLLAASLYHGGRLLSYTTLGLLAGAIGQLPLAAFFASPGVLLPWALVAVLLIYGFGLHRWLPTPSTLKKWSTRLRQRVCRFSATQGGLALGLATPLLPCGPLYALFGLCLVSGSAAQGAELALAFGLGTIPLLWIATHSFGKIRHHLSPRFLPLLQQGVALLAAILLILRLQDTLPRATPDSAQPTADPTSQSLPSCCH